MLAAKKPPLYPTQQDLLKKSDRFNRALGLIQSISLTAQLAFVGANVTCWNDHLTYDSEFVMPESLMPLLSGLFLVLAGMLIGYFLWYRDRTQDEEIRLQLQSDNDDLSKQLQKYKTERKSLTDELSSQEGKLDILQELCDDLVAGREQFQQDRLALESDVSAHRSRLELIQSRLDEERQARMTAEERLHEEQQQSVERLNAEEKSWREQLAKLQTELLHRTTDIKQLSGVNDRTTEKLHAAEATIAALKSELESQRLLVETARQNESGLEKEFVSLESTLKSHSELLQESRGQCAAALSAKQLAEDVANDLRQRLKDQQLLLSKLDATQAASESVKLRCLSLEQSLENSTDRLTHLTAQRDQAFDAEKEVRESMAALQTRNQNQEMTIRQLRAKTDEFSIKLRDIKEGRLEIESEANGLREKLQASREELEQLRRQRDELAAQLESIQKSNVEGTSLLEQRLSEVATLKRNREKLATQLATMEQQYHICEARLEERTTELRSLQAERENLTAKLADLRDERVRGEAGHEQRLAEIQQLRQERDELAGQLADSEREMAESRLSNLQQRDDIQVRLNMLISQRDQAFTEADGLRHKLKSLRDEIEELKQARSEPVILSAPFGGEYDHEYGGRTRAHDSRGVIYVDEPESRDDLKRIYGIAEVLEKRLNDFGVYTFKQIMEWEEENIQEFSMLLEFFKDRIDRDDWIGQARKLYRQKQREQKAA